MSAAALAALGRPGLTPSDDPAHLRPRSSSAPVGPTMLPGEMDDYSALAQRIAVSVADVRGCLILSRDGLVLGAYPDETRACEAGLAAVRHARGARRELRRVRRPGLGVRQTGPVRGVRRGRAPASARAPDRPDGAGAPGGRGGAGPSVSTLRVPDAASAPSGKPRTSLHPPTARQAAAPTRRSAADRRAADEFIGAPRRATGHWRRGPDACRAVGRGRAAAMRRPPIRPLDGVRGAVAPRRTPAPSADRVRRPMPTSGLGAHDKSRKKLDAAAAEELAMTTPRSTGSCWPKSSRDCFRSTRTMTKQVPDDLDRTDRSSDGPEDAMTTVKRKSKQLGQILIELGIITPEQLEQALEEHRRTPKSLGRVLIDMGMIKEARPGPRPRRAGRARVRRPRRLPDRSHRHDAAARSARPPVPRDPDRRTRRQAARGDVRPRERLRARRHPHDHEPRRPAGGRDRRRRRAGDPEVRRAWTARSRPSPASPPTRSRATTSRWRRRSRTPRSSSSCNAIMTQAVGDRASDVHIEPAEKERPRSGSAWTACCTSRCRPPEEHPGRADQPSQGHGRPEHRREAGARRTAASRMKVGGKHARPACRDPAHGATARRSSSASWTSRSALLRLEDLGLPRGRPTSGSRSRSASRTARSWSPGPTGSGKSTTMYSTLNILNEEDKNIITVEDPVEYRLAGVNQMQVNPKAGLTFASRAAVDPARRPRHRADR